MVLTIHVSISEYEYIPCERESLVPASLSCVPWTVHESHDGHPSSKEDTYPGSINTFLVDDYRSSRLIEPNHVTFKVHCPIRMPHLEAFDDRCVLSELDSLPSL